MPKPRVFISSTCYDLATIRSELRPYVEGFGYDPVMSDFCDVLFDPREHTHESCVKEISGADIVILIIGSRFGGKHIPSVQALIDFDEIIKKSSKDQIKDFKENISITQIEILKAIEEGIPVYAFVQSDVYRDHLIYEKNKSNKMVIDQIVFPSLQKNDTAPYIFEFINFITHRTSNNAIFSFANLDEIRSQLRAQWASLFQRLLSESLSQDRQTRQYREFSEQIEDLKAVILATVGTPHLRDTAKGVLRYRTMLDFLSTLIFEDRRAAVMSEISWEGLLELADIVNIVFAEDPDRGGPPFAYIVRADGTYYRVRGGPAIMRRLEEDWNDFKRLDEQAKSAVFEAVYEARDGRPLMMFRYYDRPWEEEAARLAGNTRAEDDLDDDIPF